MIFGDDLVRSEPIYPVGMNLFSRTITQFNWTKIVRKRVSLDEIYN